MIFGRIYMIIELKTRKVSNEDHDVKRVEDLIFTNTFEALRYGSI